MKTLTERNLTIKIMNVKKIQFKAQNELNSQILPTAHYYGIRRLTLWILDLH